MGDTLISPIVASYLLNLAITYTLIRTYLDNSDNLHLNGDYQKMLICFHIVKIKNYKHNDLAFATKSTSPAQKCAGLVIVICRV